MDKTAVLPLQPIIANAADYVDALSRPQPQDKPAKRKFIEGRRMRDKFLDRVIVPDEAGERPPG